MVNTIHLEIIPAIELAFASIFSLDGFSLAWALSYLFFTLYVIINIKLIRIFTEKLFGYELNNILSAKLLVSLLAVCIGVFIEAPVKLHLYAGDTAHFVYFGGLLYAPGVEFITSSASYSFLPGLLIYGLLLKTSTGIKLGFKKAIVISLIEPIIALLFINIYELF